MTQIEHDKIINLMKHGALQGINTGRLDGKCEDVIPIEDAIAIVDLIYAEKIWKKAVDEFDKNFLNVGRD